MFSKLLLLVGVCLSFSAIVCESRSTNHVPVTWKVSFTGDSEFSILTSSIRALHHKAKWVTSNETLLDFTRSDHFPAIAPPRKPKHDPVPKPEDPIISRVFEIKHISADHETNRLLQSVNEKDRNDGFERLITEKKNFHTNNKEERDAVDDRFIHNVKKNRFTTVILVDSKDELEQAALDSLPVNKAGFQKPKEEDYFKTNKEYTMANLRITKDGERTVSPPFKQKLIFTKLGKSKNMGHFGNGDENKEWDKDSPLLHPGTTNIDSDPKKDEPEEGSCSDTKLGSDSTPSISTNRKRSGKNNACGTQAKKATKDEQDEDNNDNVQDTKNAGKQSEEETERDMEKQDASDVEKRDLDTLKKVKSQQNKHISDGNDAKTVRKKKQFKNKLMKKLKQKLLKEALKKIIKQIVRAVLKVPIP